MAKANLTFFKLFWVAIFSLAVWAPTSRAAQAAAAADEDAQAAKEDEEIANQHSDKPDARRAFTAHGRLGLYQQPDGAVFGELHTTNDVNGQPTEVVYLLKFDKEKEELLNDL